MKQWELGGVTTRARRSTDGARVVDDSPRILVDQFPIAFWTTDTELCFTSALGAGLAELGIGPNQIVGTTLFDFFETDDPRHPAILSHLRALTGESVTFEMRQGRKSFHCRVGPLADSEGQQIGTICVALDDELDDRTRRHHAAERLVAAS